MVKLGRTYTDVVSGFTGVAVARCDYITGCARLQLQPRGTADKPHSDSELFDEPRLRLVEDAPEFVLDNGATPGGEAVTSMARRSLQSAVELIAEASRCAVALAEAGERRRAHRILIEFDFIAAAPLPPRLARYVAQRMRVMEDALDRPAASAREAAHAL